MRIAVSLLPLLFGAASLHAGATDRAIGGLGAYYGLPPYGMYDPWFDCAPPYRCADPVRLRIELERYRRLQELRERATPREPHTYGPGVGPWGPQRYMPPPTPEANIRPEYRDKSKLRPEYESVQPNKPTSRPGEGTSPPADGQ